MAVLFLKLLMIFFPSHQPITIPKMYAKEYHLMIINPKFIKTGSKLWVYMISYITFEIKIAIK